MLTVLTILIIYRYTDTKILAVVKLCKKQEPNIWFSSWLVCLFYFHLFLCSERSFSLNNVQQPSSFIHEAALSSTAVNNLSISRQLTVFPKATHTQRKAQKTWHAYSQQYQQRRSAWAIVLCHTAVCLFNLFEICYSSCLGLVSNTYMILIYSLSGHSIEAINKTK